MSHPVWVRGLKHVHRLEALALGHVAPRVGAWIETPYIGFYLSRKLSRTPCGCVD